MVNKCLGEELPVDKKFPKNPGRLKMDEDGN